MSAAFELGEALENLNDVSNFDIPNEHDITSEDPERLLETAVEAVAETSESITETEVFSVYCSLLKYAEHVPGHVMNKLLDSISSGLSTELDAAIRDIQTEDQMTYRAHKQPLEMYAFLLSWFVRAADLVKSSDGASGAAAAPAKGRRGKGGKAAAAKSRQNQTQAEAATAWTWFEQIPATLGLISKLLQRLNTQRLWTTNLEREHFIGCITRPAYHVAENDANMKSEAIRMSVYKVICHAVKKHGHASAAQTMIMQHLQYFEHLAEPMAECISVLAKEFDYPQLGDEILREISGMRFSGNAQEIKVPRVFSKFLIRFSEESPRSLLKQISLLLSQLDSEAYPMRIAIVEVVGAIIRDLASNLDSGADAPADSDPNPNVDSGVNNTTSSPKQIEKQIKGLYEILLERTLDLSSYVRAKVLAVLSKLCELPRKFPKQRLAVTRAAVNALEDKGAGVRRAAASLLIKLVCTHPYGLVHGGTLAVEVFEKEYEGVKKEVEELDKKVKEVVRGEDVDEEGDEGGEDDGEKKKKKKKKRDDNEMDVDEDGQATDNEEEDEEDEDEEEDEEDGEEDEDEEQDEEDADPNDDNSMAVDSEDSPAKKPKKPKKKKKSKPLKPRKSQINLDEAGAALAHLNGIEAEQLRLRKRYYVEALNFIRQIEGAMEIMAQLLGSKNKLEVLEAIEFFRVTHEYQFASAEVGIKKMIHLIWSKDNNATSEDGNEVKGVRARLLECYRSLYFDVVPDLPPKEQVNRIAKNMVELTYDATLAELTSLEEMIRTMMEDGQVHQDVINKLWQIFSAERHLPKPQRRGAIIILGMLALAKRSVLADKVDVMLKVGLGALGKRDLTLARYTCVALQRLNGSAKKVKGSLYNESVRYDMSNPIFRRLQDAVERPCRSKEWFGLAEQAINTIYALGDHPDSLCTELIKKLTVRVFTPKDTAATQEQQQERDPDAMDEDQPQSGDADDNDNGDKNTSSQPSAESSAGGDKGDAFELAQLLFVVGHVAIKQIVYLELVERELKRQKDEKQAAEKARKGPQAAQKDGEELDQVAGNAEDEIGERIAETRENEMLYGEDSLLALYGPMLVNICGSPQKFKNLTLRAAATLSLSKFLCVSSQFCDRHHFLLFKLLESSKQRNIRSNIVIALGDVAVSFSNIIDENSNELYKGLSDKDPMVKKNTLMVLTHLILNGMVKVKGQLGEMAKCLEDEDTRIADLAKLFFTELSTKDNAIYNNLPDVISHLSTGEHAVDEEKFQSTLKYIFTFIEKEKQAENIVEKLCQRFRLSEDARQWRDIAFCLSLLPYKSEKSVKKLVEGLPLYRDKLHEPKVYERFTEILTKARQNKTGKNDMGAELESFEQILEEHKRQGEDDQALEKRAQGKKAAAKKRATRKNARRKAVKAENESDGE